MIARSPSICIDLNVGPECGTSCPYAIFRAASVDVGGVEYLESERDGQIYLYGGCLGYEYYVKPILHGKGDSWAKLYIVSSVVEVTASANEFAAPAIAKIIYGIQYNGRSSWRNIMLTVRNSVGDSTFGVSGVLDNCYTPTGSRCN